MQKRRANKSCSKAMSYRHPSFTALLVVFFIAPSSSAANDFDPYSMNGGLVSAVAGKDFVVVASDTRLTDGYEILTRKHLQSRLWVASGGTHHHSSLVSNDGSVVIPTEERSSCSNTNPSSTDGTSRTINSISPPPSIGQSPTLIASAGCSSDCEALKRQIRSEIDSHVHWNYGTQTLTPTGVANLLGQTLYSRRGFPFYSFCIVAGLDDGGGVVHVYDAIGSHERVAVACAGTGKEMLQPILDRMFASISTTTRRSNRGGPREDEVMILENSEEHGLPKLVRDGKAVHATKQRVGLKLQPPVKTFVNCSAEEAVALLVRGYRSVAEREIAVGDDVVLCVIRKGQDKESRLTNGDEKDGPSTMEVFYYPLKKH